MRLIEAAVCCQIAFFGCSGIESSSERTVASGRNSSVDEQPPAQEASEDSACLEGEKRSCHFTLKMQGDVSGCFIGIQICKSNVWAKCESDKQQ